MDVGGLINGKGGQAVWVELGENFPDVEVCIRHVTLDKMRALQERHRLRRGKDGKLQAEVETDVLGLINALIDQALVDWRGVLSDGEPLPYAASVAKEVAAMDYKFGAALITAVTDYDAYQRARQAERRDS